MSLRAISSATISFGLVSIPVKIYSASNSQASVRFHMVEKESGARVKQQYISTKTGEVVDRKTLVKGYEFSKGQMVLFTDEEYKALLQEASQSLDITEFIPTDAVDPIWYDKSYFLGPDKGGERAYHLLTHALEHVGRSAIAKYAARGKQYIVQLRPMDGGILMQQLHYEFELRSMKDVPLGEKKVNEAEVDLALQIVSQAMSDSFDPSQYQDEVRTRILAAIERKVQGEDIVSEPEGEPKAQVIDLMEALKASLDKKAAAKSARPAAAKRKAAKKTTRKKKAAATKRAKA